MLVNEQVGLRTNSSTRKANFNLISGILNAQTNKKTVGGIFCDLEKAFDCVNHDLNWYFTEQEVKLMI